MATRSKRAAREDAKAHTTVAYRGHELDELIAQSSELRVMSQTELLEAAPTVAQDVLELDDDDYELSPISREETVEALEQETLEAAADEENDHEPMPESVPIVESTVVLASTTELARELSQHSIHIPTFDSHRPVAYDVPSTPSTMLPVPPTAYTLSDGIETAVLRSPARAPALITLTIAVVAITVGVLLGSSFSEALSQPPPRANAATTVATTTTATVAANTTASAPEPAPPPRHAEPRTSVDEKVSLADAGVREKAVRPTKPIGMMIGGRRQASSQEKSQAAFEAELRSKMEKAATPSADALGEAQLNRPF
jgi:hypothetical protein